MEEDIQRYESKINFLDSMSNNFFSRLNSRSKSMSHSEFEEDVINLKEKIRKLNVDLSELKLATLYLIKVLKQTASSTDFKVAEQKVNDWQLEKMITKKEFKKLIQENSEL